MTATGAKFSEAIISRVVCWRRSSASTASAISGSSIWRGWWKVVTALGSLGECGVGVSAQDLAERLDTHTKQPALAVWVRADRLRGIHDRRIDVDDIAGRRGVQVADGLGGFKL